MVQCASGDARDGVECDANCWTMPGAVAKSLVHVGMPGQRQKFCSSLR